MIHLGSVDDGSSQPKRDKRVTTRSHGLTEYLRTVNSTLGVGTVPFRSVRYRNRFARPLDRGTGAPTGGRQEKIDTRIQHQFVVRSSLCGRDSDAGSSGWCQGASGGPPQGCAGTSSRNAGERFPGGSPPARNKARQGTAFGVVAN